MSALCFIDTETTGLSLDDDIWEFAGVRVEADGTETEMHLFIEHDEQKCAMLPEPFRTDHYKRFPSHGKETDRRSAAHQIHGFFRAEDGSKPHVVGAVPSFDTERLWKLISSVRADRSAPWHYHLIDVENLVVGYLAGDQGMRLEPPWDSDDLSRRIHVDPDLFQRHTAMSDVRWAMAIYDTVMGA